MRVRKWHINAFVLIGVYATNIICSLIFCDETSCWVNACPFYRWRHQATDPEVIDFKAERLKINIWGAISSKVLYKLSYLVEDKFWSIFARLVPQVIKSSQVKVMTLTFLGFWKKSVSSALEVIL